MMTRRDWIQYLGLSVFVSAPAWAEKRPFLRLRGNIRKFTDEGKSVYDFTEADFMRLPQSAITTSTLWTEKSKFEGPRLAEVLRAVDAEGNRLKILALDDYSIEVPMGDLGRYQVILAHSKDGKRMAVDTFGPTWLVYPRDQFPAELGGPVTTAKFIWQVWQITVL